MVYSKQINSWLDSGISFKILDWNTVCSDFVDARFPSKHKISHWMGNMRDIYPNLSDKELEDKLRNEHGFGNSDRPTTEWTKYAYTFLVKSFSKNTITTSMIKETLWDKLDEYLQNEIIELIVE